jgi:putative addiction module killer protein
MKIKTIFYTTSSGDQPFSDWYWNLDNEAYAIVTARLKRVELGNFGDCKLLKQTDGVWEIRIDYGPGYRIYFGRQGSEVVVLLVGGDKGSQRYAI